MNLLMTPHIAWTSQGKSREELIRGVYKNDRKFLQRVLIMRIVISIDLLWLDSLFGADTSSCKLCHPIIYGEFEKSDA